MALDERLVHLDLKGAPPKVSYLEQLFPLLQKWGTTGLLMEYEDMFPYTGDLAVLQAKYAYSKEDIQKILLLAKQHELQVIPLVQTFGHLEFVLKHQKFREFREVADFPMTLCPLNEGSIELVIQMLEQVMSLHPDCTSFHIGADEVFHLGLCEKCQAYLSDSTHSPSQLFFIHVQRVVEHLKATHPNCNIIMWDDMYRELDVASLKASGIGDLVEPMVWYYMTNSDCLPAEMFDRYSKVFSSIWCATAFKGATGPCKFTTDIGYHVINHQLWLKLTQDHRHKFAKWKGTALTGWQRYDHYSVLCEVLPVSVPSLALCLHILRHGAFTLEVHQKASAELGFSEIMPLNLHQCIGVISDCSFPGSRIFNLIQMYLKLKLEYKQFIKNDRLNGWMSRYHIRYNYTNPAHLNNFLPQAKQLLDSLEQFKKDMSDGLSDVFFDDTVEEWLIERVEERINRLTEIVQTVDTQLKYRAKPKDNVVQNNDMDINS